MNVCILLQQVESQKLGAYPTFGAVPPRIAPRLIIHVQLFINFVSRMPKEKVCHCFALSYCFVVVIHAIQLDCRCFLPVLR